MKAWPTIRLVAGRELREGVRSRAIRASLVVQVLLVVAIALFAAASGSDDGPPSLELGVVSTEPQPVVRAARAQQQGSRAQQQGFELRLRVRELPDAVAARRAVREEEVDAALTGGRLLVPGDPDAALVALLQSASRSARSAQNLRDAGLTQPQIAAAMMPAPLATERVAAQEGGGEGLAFLGSLLLYIAVISCGYAIASGVVTEKNSRVVEIVLSAIRPSQLLAGKVLGVGLIGLMQIVIVVSAGLGVALATGSVDMPSTTGQTAALVTVYFLLGYALFGMAFAGAASIVSRQEDIQSTTMPLMVILIGGYVLSTTALGNPDGTLAVVGTFLPPIAPMIVPGRAAQAALPAWQLAASIALMLLTVLVVAKVAARLYARSVLRFGAPMKLTEALRRRGTAQ